MSKLRLPRPSRKPSHRRRQRLNVEPLEDRQLLAPFVVTNTNDDGPGSLREAIMTSNGSDPWP